MRPRPLLPAGATSALLAALLILSACSTTGPGASGGPASAPASARPSDASGGGSGVVEPTPGTSAAPVAPLTSDPLHLLTLTDVTTGEQIMLGGLAAQKPLLLETMAIWCINCKAQQRNVDAAHLRADFHSISLDVEPNENPDQLAKYADREGFDWHFAMADGELVARLRERFGTGVAVPPAMPKILFRTDGSIELIGLGELWSADQIAGAVGG